MSFKRTVRENSKVHNFLPNLYNNPPTFLKFLGLYFDEFPKITPAPHLDARFCRSRLIAFALAHIFSSICF